MNHINEADLSNPKFSSHSGELKSSRFTGYLLPAVVLLFIAALAGLRASTVLMWYDEVATYEPARLASGAKTLSFFTTGLDTPSPIPALLLHYWMSIAGDADFTNRLPFVFFYVVMCWFTYSFTARRYPRGYASAAVLFIAASGAFEYSTEMRSYLFILCSLSVMMWSWQRFEDGRSRIAALCVMWVALAVALLSHVFSIFLIVPFALAELYRWRWQKVLNKSVWVVLFTAPLSILLLLPSMRAANHNYAQHFWSRPTLLRLVESYIWGIRKPGVAAIAVTLLVIYYFRRSRNKEVRETDRGKAKTGFTGPEWVFVLALAAMPLYAFIGSFAIGVFVPRYVICVAIGIALTVVGFAAQLLRFNRKAGLVLAAIFMLAAAAGQYRSFAQLASGRFGSGLVWEIQHQPWELSLCESNLPVLGSDPHDFFEYQHYAPPCLRDKLSYADDPQKAELFPNSVTDEENMKFFSRLLPLRVVSFDSFASQNSEFLIFSVRENGETNAEWLLPFLSSKQSEFRIVSQKSYDKPPYANSAPGTVTIYRVKKT